MRILATARHPGGGIRSYLRAVYGHAALREHEITLLTTDGDFARLLCEELPTVRGERTVAGDARALFRATRGALREGAFDLLHSHGFTAGAMGELARTGSGVPHLMTAHDVFVPQQFEGLSGRLRQTLLGTLLRRVDVIHAVSEDGAANLTAYLPAVRSERVHTILHGVDVPRFHDAPQAPLRRSLGLPDTTRIVGFFGRFMGQKGFRTLVLAVRALLEAGAVDRQQLRVVTFGWGGYIREDYAWLETLGLGDCFLQHPHTDEPERYLKACDVVAMPSRWEACGLLAMEALVAGVPIVGTDCVGLREVLEGSPARVISVGDHEALAEALASELRRPRREAFRAYAPTAAGRFGLDRAAEGLAALYRGLAA